MLTVVVKEPDLNLMKTVQQELLTVEGELLRVDDWSKGLDYAKGDFIVFLETGCSLSPGYLRTNLNIYKGNPLFRKMGGLGSEVGGNYGWHIESDLVKSSASPTSSRPYPVQVIYLFGSIFRLNVLKKVFEGFSDNPMVDSVNVSLAIWSSGNRCYLNPKTTYGQVEIHYRPFLKVDVDQKLTSLFKREFIR